jgi:hypothetical protein
VTDENLTLRTWRQGGTVMATAHSELNLAAVMEAILAARRRWPTLADAPATLLADRHDQLRAREIAAELEDIVGDVRQVDGLPDPGWAAAWPRAVDYESLYSHGH